MKLGCGNFKAEPLSQTLIDSNRLSPSAGPGPNALSMDYPSLPLHQSNEGGDTGISISQGRKPRLREANRPARSHTAGVTKIQTQAICL